MVIMVLSLLKGKNENFCVVKNKNKHFINVVYHLKKEKNYKLYKFSYTWDMTLLLHDICKELEHIKNIYSFLIENCSINIINMSGPHFTE
jgi:hypothetical protein